jgi:subtilisin-like proprotein convertase family protein
MGEEKMNAFTNHARHRFATALTAAAVCSLHAPARAAVPSDIAIQAHVTTVAGGPVADGDYKVKLALYAAKAGGAALWQESHAKVSIKGGVMRLRVGSVAPVSAKALAVAGGAWLGIQVGADPEFPRSQFAATAYAIVAKTAKTAHDLDCSGCVSIKEMKFDGDLSLGNHTLNVGKLNAGSVVANSVVASSFVGDGSKLTGITATGGKQPVGMCNSGEVMVGIKADGSIACATAAKPGGGLKGGKCKAGQVVTEVKADGSVVCAPFKATLPADGLGQVSNGLLHNVFNEVIKSKGSKDIPDNKPGGVLDEIVVPDLGIAQQLAISVNLQTSDISGLEVVVYDPNNTPYVLHKKTGNATSLHTSYPTKTKPVSGDLASWVGKNPKGTWRLIVTDWKPTKGGFDGKLISWSVDVKTLSTKKVGLNGALHLNGKPLQEAISKALSFKCSTKQVTWNKGKATAKGLGPFTINSPCKQPGFVVGYFYSAATKGYGNHYPINSIPSYPTFPYNSSMCNGKIKVTASGAFEITCLGSSALKGCTCYSSFRFICCETAVAL